MSTIWNNKTNKSIYKLENGKLFIQALSRYIMGQISLIQMDNNNRLLALQRLGYDLDDKGYVLDTNNGNKEVICKYSKEKVHINTAAILPGSVIVINATPETMAQYFLDQNDEE